MELFIHAFVHNIVIFVSIALLCKDSTNLMSCILFYYTTAQEDGVLEVLAKGGTGGKNLLAMNESYPEWATYLIENQVASNSNFPFQLIAIAFGALNVFFGILWFNLGFSLDEDEKVEVFGTLEIADSFFLSLQMLTTGGYDDAVPGFAFRIVYFFARFYYLLRR